MYDWGDLERKVNRVGSKLERQLMMERIRKDERIQNFKNSITDIVTSVHEIINYRKLVTYGVIGGALTFSVFKTMDYAYANGFESFPVLLTVGYFVSAIKTLIYTTKNNYDNRLKVVLGSSFAGGLIGLYSGVLLDLTFINNIPQGPRELFLLGLGVGLGLASHKVYEGAKYVVNKIAGD